MIPLNMHLPEFCYMKLVNPGETALSAAKYPASGSFIDVSGYKKFGFLVAQGAGNSATVVQVEAADAVDGTPADLTGATITIDATSGDNDLHFIAIDQDELSDPSAQRYVTLDVTVAAGGDDYAAIIFWGIPYKIPATHDAGTVIVQVDPS